MTFLDANILIELVVPGRSKYKPVRQLLSGYQEVCASMLSVHLAWHFGRQAGVKDRLIAAIIDSCNLVELSVEDYRWAVANEKGKDFEDALQVACALRSNCAEIVTIDRMLAKRYEDQIKFIVP